jgi:uncharacterized membrane protein YebE (DUF533 family)
MITAASASRSIPPDAPTLPALTALDRGKVLRFAASFLWADCNVVESERVFLADLARELGADDARAEVAGLLAQPPVPEEVDPNDVSPAVADVIRHAALRAIAADGRVDRKEMAMFEVLDDLLPRADLPPAEL